MILKCHFSGMIKIHLGKDQLFKTGTIVKAFQVDRIERAPNYNYPSEYSNDIALLRLTEKVDLTVYTPVCLPAHNQTFTGRQATVIGWGATSDTDFFSDTLQEVEGVPVLSDSECRTALESVQGFSGSDISSDMLCTGEELGRGACRGDSGGPLMVEEDSRYTLIGVVSWGLGECGQTSLPGVYAEVSSKSLRAGRGIEFKSKCLRIHSVDKRNNFST